MLVDLSEWQDLAEKIGDTKRIILESCLTPKHWSDLKEVTKKSEPTLLVHVNDLIQMRFISKNEEDKTYQTTEQGVKFLALVPHVRPLPQAGKYPYELVKVIGKGIKLGHLSLKEHLEQEILGLQAFSLDRNFKKYYEAVVYAIRNAVTLWTPEGIEPDKNMYKEVNKLIGLYTKKHKEESSKITMVIEFDFATSLDMVIREEKDEIIKKRLEENRDLIIKQVHASWHKIFNQMF